MLMHQFGITPDVEVTSNDSINSFDTDPMLQSRSLPPTLEMKRQLLGDSWRQMDVGVRHGWDLRSKFLNERPLPGDVLICPRLPSTIDCCLRTALSKDFKDVANVMKRAVRWKIRRANQLKFHNIYKFGEKKSKLN